MLRNETVEDQQNVIEEMVDEVECNDDGELDEVEEVAAAEPGSSYTVHPSGRLTLVFRNSPQPSPTHSPAMPSADSKAVDPVRDVRVKLERCDDDDDAASAATPSKRSRLDEGGQSSLPVVLLQRLKSETKDEITLSEADAAVASLLECSSISEDYVPDTTNKVAAEAFGQLQNGLDVYSTEVDSVQYNGVFSTAEIGISRSAEQFSKSDAVITNVVGDSTLDVGGRRYTQTEASEGEIVTAVDNLMADLSQLDAEASDTVRTFIPNGSVYLPTAEAKISEAKRTVADAEPLDSLSLSDGIDSVVNVEQLSTSTTTFSSAFCSRVNFAMSDHEPDLEAAIKSILS